MNELDYLPYSASPILTKLVEQQKQARLKWKNALGSWLGGRMADEVYESIRMSYLDAVEESRKRFEFEFGKDTWVY